MFSSNCCNGVISCTIFETAVVFASMAVNNISIGAALYINYEHLLRPMLDVGLVTLYVDQWRYALLLTVHD